MKTLSNRVTLYKDTFTTKELCGIYRWIFNKEGFSYYD